MPNAINLLIDSTLLLNYSCLNFKAFSLRLILILGPSPCDSNPCQNGALCMEDLDSFICDCSFGFDGSFCQSLIGENNCYTLLEIFSSPISRHFFAAERCQFRLTKMSFIL